MLPSEWAHQQWVEAVERGDTSAANDYMQLYHLWKSRNQ